MKLYCNKCNKSFCVNHPMLFFGECEHCYSVDIVEVEPDTPLTDVSIAESIMEVTYMLGESEV